MLRPILTAFLLFLCGHACAEGELLVRAYPPLPPRNHIVNGGFELTHMHQYLPRIDRLSGWSQWPFESPWGFLTYPDGDATQDKENRCLGYAAMRLRNSASGKPRFLVQIVAGKDYTYTVPSATGATGLNDLFEEDLDDIAIEELVAPTHVLSFWAKTDGVIPGRVELFNVKTPPGRARIAFRDFENTSWQKIDVPFAAPEQGSALMVSLGLTASEPAGATVWYDGVSLLPANATLKYEARLPALVDVTVRDKTNNAVLLTSTAKRGSLEVRADGVYRVEARDRNGETLSVDYPAKSIAHAESLVANGGFEQDNEKPLHWGPYRSPYPKFGPLPPPTGVTIDKRVYREGTQSLCVQFSSMALEALVQEIAAASYLPEREYVFSFWAKTGTTGACNVVLDNIRGSYLLYLRVPNSPEWQHHRYVFTTPARDRFGAPGSAKPNDGLMVLVIGPRDKSGLSTVWLDDVVVRPLQEGEADAFDLLTGLEKDITAFHRSVIREQVYDAETAIDRLQFSIDDLRDHGVTDASRHSALRTQVDTIRQRWQAASDRINATYHTFLKSKERIALEGRWDEATGLADGLKGWQTSWPEQADRVLRPLRTEVEALDESIGKEKQRLAALKAEQEWAIVAREQQAFAGDYLKALSAIQSADPEQREKGVLELGRLGHPDAAPLLMDLLRDDGYPVRRNALYALAWMRATNAVPAIVSLLKESRDPWTRRRAAQALGMIGDARAAPLLKRLLVDPDQAVRQNAIVSLGWLREPSAVQALTDIVREYIEKYHGDEPATEPQTRAITPAPDTEGVPAFDLFGDGGTLPSRPATGPATGSATGPPTNPDTTYDWRRDAALNSPHYTAAVAVQSLGLIGDPAVKPLLMELTEQHLTEDLFLLIQRAAIFALGQLGDRDAEPLLRARSKDIYVWRGDISREALNALATLEAPDRPKPLGIRQPAFMTQKRYFYWLDQHFHRTFGRWFQEKNRPRDVAGALRYAGAAGANQFFEWKVPAPLAEGKRYFESAHSNELRCLIASLYGGECNKDYVNRMVHYYGAYPAFAGIWNEEGPGGYLDDIRNKPWGLNPEVLEQIERDGIGPDFRWEHRELFAQYAEALEQDVLDGLRESREYLHMLRKGTLLAHYTSVCSTTFTPWPTLSLWGRMAHSLDIVGSEPSYSTATYENGMFAEMCRDGSEVCNGMEIYIWRLPAHCTRRWEIGMGISLLHARQFYAWYWGDVFKQLNSVERGRPEAWAITGSMFKKMKKLEPYLVNGRGPGEVALVYSGRTSCLLYRDDEKDRLRSHTSGAGENLYTRNAIGIYQALAYEHTQCDVIWADTMTDEKLRNYKVLVLADAKTLTPTEEALLREWVGNGGSLIATGTTALFDQYGNARTDYGLADVLGVRFMTNTCTIPLENIDSGKGVAAEYVGTFVLNGESVEYDLSYGYDKVEPRTAEVLAEWAGSHDAAATLNAFGKGRCLFVTATYPGIMYKPGRTIYRWPLFKHFRKGIPQMLSGLVRQGLALADTKQALFVENCPWYVETHIRTQPDKQRLLFQLLNYDERKLPVHGVTANVRVPGPVTRITYGDDDLSIPFKQDQGYVRFAVRDFEIHEAAVIEYRAGVAGR